MNKYQANQIWGTLYENTWPLVFNSVKTMKDKKRHKKCHRMEKAKETQGLNTMGYPNLDSGKEEKHQKKIWGNLDGVFSLVNSIIPMSVS